MPVALSHLYGLEAGVWVEPELAEIRPDTSSAEQYFPERTLARWLHSSLFVNPLMTLYFAVTVESLAARNLYLDRIEQTWLTRQISSAVEEFRDSLPAQRPPRMFPH